MKADEKRSHRLRLLTQVWNNSGKDEQAVFDRAIQMGVTKITAQSYVDAIKRRFPK